MISVRNTKHSLIPSLVSLLPSCTTWLHCTTLSQTLGMHVLRQCFSNAVGTSPRTCRRHPHHIATATLWAATRTWHQRSRLLLSLRRGCLGDTPLLMRLVLVLPHLHRGMFGKCLDVHRVESRSECQPHAQHMRVTALHEVAPWGEVLEGSHCEAL